MTALRPGRSHTLLGSLKLWNTVGASRSSPSPRSPLHLHTDPASPQLAQRLFKPGLPGLRQLGAHDPTYLVVALVRGALLIHSHGPALR